LIQLGADLTAQDDNGLSVIFHCIQSSINFWKLKAEEFGLKLFNYLLENHRDSFDLERGYRDNEFILLLFTHVNTTMFQYWKLLVEKYNANLQPDPNDPNYAFTSAIYYNSSKVIDYLLTNHRHLFDINALDGNLTPFLYCCKWVWGKCDYFIKTWCRL
jgi:hypothetical protein